MALASVQTSGTELTRKARRLRMIAEDAVEDAVRSARRSLKRGVEGARDLRDDSIYRIKHRPLQSVGMALGIGVVLGLAAGLMIRGCRRAD